jgi:hypothetical protein
MSLLLLLFASFVVFERTLTIPRVSLLLDFEFSIISFKISSLILFVEVSSVLSSSSKTISGTSSRSTMSLFLISFFILSVTSDTPTASVSSVSSLTS